MEADWNGVCGITKRKCRRNVVREATPDVAVGESKDSCGEEEESQGNYCQVHAAFSPCIWCPSGGGCVLLLHPLLFLLLHCVFRGFARLFSFQRLPSLGGARGNKVVDFLDTVENLGLLVFSVLGVEKVERGGIDRTGTAIPLRCGLQVAHLDESCQSVTRQLIFARFGSFFGS